MTDPAFDLFDSFTGTGTMPVAAAVTVTEYAARIEQAVNRVGGALLEGEVQKVNPWNGMLFFTVTDGSSSLQCMVFRNDARRLEHMPRKGDGVQLVVDRAQFRKDRGTLTLIVSRITLAGEGELLRRREALLAGLTAEGLCRSDRHRPLPVHPRAVGVIAGQGSDALSDVTRALHDRWPGTHIVIATATVTGVRAPREIIDALARLQAHACVDVIILARGGGSVRDLACFDDESLCRAIAACSTPVITAIGHTDNVPVCNHVAWNATTPSRSAEMAVPSAREARATIVAAAALVAAVPGRVQRRADHAAAVRLDVSRRLDLLRERTVLRTDVAAKLQSVRADVAAEGHAVTNAVTGFIHGHAVAIRDLRATVERVPRRASDTLDRQRADVAERAAVLQAAVVRVDRAQGDVVALGQRVDSGTQRQLKDHARDYGRAAARLTAEARAGLDRGAARIRQNVADQGVKLTDRAAARLTGARRDVRHAAELVAARDFRRAGWVLVGHDDQPIRGIAGMHSGQAVTLDFHDGRATATVDHTNTTTKEQHP